MKLYNYQTKVLEAVASGKHLVKGDCSMGKTLCSLMWAKSTGKDKVLVITTASCRDAKVFEREIEKFGEVFSGWYRSLLSFSVVSWSGLAKWTQANWSSLDEWAIIFDECLPADTPVQTKHGEVQIADLKVGDEVLSYNEETKQTEYKHVTRLIKKTAPDKMYCLRSQNGAIISTGNHPHYTQRGWIPASEIKVGDVLYESKTNGDRTQAQEIWRQREVCVLSNRDTSRRMDDITNTASQSGENILRQNMQSSTSKRSIESTYEEAQSNGQSSMETQSYTNKTIQRNTTYMDFKTRTQRGKRELQSTTNTTMERTMQGKQRVGNGTTCEFGEENLRVSKQLQARHRECLLQDRDRVRWTKPQFSSQPEERQEEGRQIKGVRVESVEVLEREDIKRCKLYRDPDYVYCIDVEDNHNFFANGFLTHNCQRGKAGISSQQGKAFLQICKRTDCWTGWTATPGDKWEDYYAYFTATGKTRNKTDFKNQFCVYQNYPFPKLVATQNEDKYMAIKNEIWHEVDSSEMEAELPPTLHQTIKFKQPAGYKQLMKTHELDGEFLDNASALAHAARRLCGSKQKLDWLSDFVDGLDGSCIVFYSYETERDAIEKMLKGKVGKIWNINGKTHDVPTEDTIGKHDVVLAQWQAGAFGLNLQFMNYWVSFSPNYSYTISEQARKRIHRKGQTKTCKYWYLVCENTIDEDVYTTLRSKKDFDETMWGEVY